METGDSEGIELEQNSGDNDHLSSFIIDAGVIEDGNTLLEDATAGAGKKILLDASAEVGIDDIVLDGTDVSSSNAGERILQEGRSDTSTKAPGFVSESLGNPNVRFPKIDVDNILLENSPIS